MKSKIGKVIYVGKATSLRKRVRSYFSKVVDTKTDSLLKNIEDIDYIECISPEQALILEAALIKEKKPKYNISLRDNKSYPYIEITNEEFPRILISRQKQQNKNILFG
ncbi:MAG: GIY-YIG nuclease family protein, partial [Candidatus Susulua stagnicola]|nr:GIY-YIG nuclease family protein [Candidatus Susulua stagnicola]